MTNDKELFDSELEKLLSDPRIIRLCKFPQHHGSNTLDHCVAVARRAFELAEKLEWKIDEKELARGAMLHDYYQYSIKEQGLTAYKHGTSHPQIAMEKADKDFKLTDKEKNIIRGHMWPLTFAHPPKSKDPSPKRRSWSVLRTRTWQPGSSHGLRSKEREELPERSETGFSIENNIHIMRSGTAPRFRAFLISAALILLHFNVK